MEIRVLKYFLTVAKECSITRAANVLHLTQPTLSRQLQDLEKELGQKLFIRGSHNITLTPEGVILRKRAEEIIDMVEKTQAEFNAISEAVSGDIYIGGGETASMKYIAEVMMELQKEYPHKKYSADSGFLDWFGNEFDNLNITATYNLIYNASIMVKKGMGYAIALDKLINTDSDSEICFKELTPKLTSGLDIAWKKGQVFSPAAKLFLERLKEKFLV